MKYFLAFWCAEGIEHLTEITHAAPENVGPEQMQAAILGESYDDPSKDVASMVQAMRMRGRFNPQRQYELWGFTTDDDVEFHDITSWADRDTQSFVDWVRKNGTSFLDDRIQEPTRKIR